MILLSSPPYDPGGDSEIPAVCLACPPNHPASNPPAVNAPASSGCPTGLDARVSGAYTQHASEAARRASQPTFSAASWCHSPGNTALATRVSLPADRWTRAHMRIDRHREVHRDQLARGGSCATGSWQTRSPGHHRGVPLRACVSATATNLRRVVVPRLKRAGAPRAPAVPTRAAVSTGVPATAAACVRREPIWNSSQRTEVSLTTT